MCTRGIWQLEKLTFRYCAHSGSSRGIRELFETPRFVEYAQQYPSVQFESTLKPGRHPVLIGNYFNGKEKVADLKNKYKADVYFQMDRMVQTSGRKMTKISKPIVSRRQSVQGIWQPGFDSGVAFKATHKL